MSSIPSTRANAAFGINPASVKFLTAEKEKVLSENALKQEHWHKIRSEYSTLSVNLQNYCEEISHDVMVPFSKKAFIPGQLIHTNEVTVLLGDNWFVKTSTKHALEICERRMKRCDSMLLDLGKEQAMFDSWKQQIQMLDEGGDVLEINEEYDEEKEKMWRIKHRESVKAQKQKEAEERKKIDFNDNSYWEQFEVQELESFLQEREEKFQQRKSETRTEYKSETKMECKSDMKMERKSEKKIVQRKIKPKLESICETIAADPVSETDAKPRSGNRRVSFAQPTESDSDSEPFVINFTHSPQSADELPVQSDTLQTPGDILKFFAPSEESVVHVKSILKTSKNKINSYGKVQMPIEESDEPLSDSAGDGPSFCAAKAVEENISEHPATIPEPVEAMTEEPRKVSLFRASRKKQNS